ncbi:stage II sporulation protein P [Evansella sp. AB-rgal1]|uniref:stage II sporulation protein P n=1 Tax=Evansella sp. AB-rgal1 TaxID=3242696 RepID=UPI00359E934C
MKKRPIRNIRRKPNINRKPNLSRTSSVIHKGISSILLGVLSLFITVSILTAFGPGYSLSFASINEASRNIPNEMFVMMMGMENQYYKQSLPEDFEQPSLSSTVFELATSIDPGDHRSLLGREIPGFALFDGRIILAGEGVDYTNMPIESSPPMEVLMAEREAANERLDEMARLREQMSKRESLDNVVHIIHSHNRESYFPELKLDDTSDANLANHGSVNITLVGERLGMELANYGIGSVVDTSDISGELNNRGWLYRDSYRMSREVLQSDIEEHGEFDFYFDLHRDSQPKERTTVEIHGEYYARILFVLGKGNPQHGYNEQVMKDLHQRVEESHPGLSRGIFEPRGSVNGVYNQDISPNSILIEFGGVENSLEEVYRTVEVFAEIFSDYYWELQIEGGE